MSSEKYILARLDYELDQCHNPAAIILGREESDQFDKAIAALTLAAIASPHKHNGVHVIRLTYVKNKLLVIEGDRLYTLKVTEDSLQSLLHGEVNQYIIAAVRNQLRGN